jgi:hypothetical protein
MIMMSTLYWTNTLSLICSYSLALSAYREAANSKCNRLGFDLESEIYSYPLHHLCGCCDIDPWPWHNFLLFLLFLSGYCPVSCTEQKDCQYVTEILLKVVVKYCYPHWNKNVFFSKESKLQVCQHREAKWNYFLYLFRTRVMVLNTNFNNISVISWRSVLLVEETGVYGKNHRSAASHLQSLSHYVELSTPRHERDSNSQL